MTLLHLKTRPSTKEIFLHIQEKKMMKICGNEPSLILSVKPVVFSEKHHRYLNGTDIAIAGNSDRFLTSAIGNAECNLPHKFAVFLDIQMQLYNRPFLVLEKTKYHPLYGVPHVPGLVLMDETGKTFWFQVDWLTSYFRPAIFLENSSIWVFPDNPE